MNRRRALRVLGGLGLGLLLGPRFAVAESADELAREAQAALTGGDTDTALSLLRDAVAEDARNDRVQALLGRTYLQRGDARAALRHFTLAVRLNPEDTLSRIMMETIRQFPLPPRKGKKAPPARPSRSNALAAAAEAERKSLLGEGATTGGGPRRLLLDPGHGGVDAGAPGAGLREADVTLDIALRLARAFSGHSDAVDVMLTRTADVDLPGWARAALAGFYGADLLVSIHATRLPDSGAKGIGLYAFAAKASDELAEAVGLVENAAFDRRSRLTARPGVQAFLSATRRAAGAGHLQRGRDAARDMAAALKSGAPLALHGVGTAPLQLLAEADAPAVLVETGFLSNPADAAVLGTPEKRQQLADALARAVLAALGVTAAGGDKP